jgi:hypothetical protein
MYPLCTHDLSTVLLHAWTCSTRSFLIKLLILSLTVSCQNGCVEAVLKFALFIYWLTLVRFTAKPISLSRCEVFRIRWRSWGSSVNIMSDYGLDDRGSIPGRSKGFSFRLCVQTSSEAHPVSYPMGTRGSILGGIARPGRDADRSPQSSAEIKNE